MPRITLRGITPRKAKILDTKIMRREMEKEGIDDAKKQLKAMAERTVSTWKDKPKFKSRNIFTSDTIAVDVTPSKDKAGQRWIWINDGTPARIIVPKKPGGLLWFRPKSFPKTRTGLLGSLKGRRGGKLVPAKKVNHPGIKARKWTKAMAKEYRKRFLRQMNNAMKRISRASQA